MMKTAIIANGVVTDKKFHKEILDKADIVICADGGANHADDMGIVPDYIIGDMDSVKPELLTKFRQLGKEIIEDTDQDKTDTELALELAQKLGSSEIQLLGALGLRLDHTMANIFYLIRFPHAKILDEKHEIFLVEDLAKLKGETEDIVSVIPLTDVKNLKYKGLKWNVDRATELGWLGICNELVEENAEIRVKSGKVVVMRLKNGS